MTGYDEFSLDWLIGRKVLLKNEHPHSGCVGVIISIERTLYADAPRVRLTPSHLGIEECMIMSPDDFELVRE